MATQRLKYLRAIGVALGVTSIYLLWLLGPLVTSTHESIYHWDSFPSQLFVAPILDFCAFWLLLSLVLIFIGLKMLGTHYMRIPTEWALAIVLFVVGASIFASLLNPQTKRSE